MSTHLKFGSALSALMNGNRIARAGWNGKNMFLFLNPGSHDFGDDDAVPSFVEGIPAELFNKGDTGTGTRLPNINMRTASGSTVTGWLASQTDMLASDWCVLADDVEPE